MTDIFLITSLIFGALYWIKRKDQYLIVQFGFLLIAFLIFCQDYLLPLLF